MEDNPAGAYARAVSQYAQKSVSARMREEDVATILTQSGTIWLNVAGSRFLPAPSPAVAANVAIPAVGHLLLPAATKAAY